MANQSCGKGVEDEHYTELIGIDVSATTVALDGLEL
jgi:hypothetical protein